MAGVGDKFAIRHTCTNGSFSRYGLSSAELMNAYVGARAYKRLGVAIKSASL